MIRQYTCHGSRDIASALDGAYAAATEKMEQCAATRWTFTLYGKTVGLADVVDSVLPSLDRFKAVGDVAVNADLMHVGLPWAGIRLILELRISCTVDVQDVGFGGINKYTGDGLKIPSDGSTVPQSPNLSLCDESVEGAFRILHQASCVRCDI